MAGVVLVHGAWHGAWCWTRVVEDLQRRGVTVDAVELPLSSFSGDVRVAREAAEAMGPDTVVVGHSYGGLVISEAAANLPTVSHLVYVAAFLVEAGVDAAAILAEYGSPISKGVVLNKTGVTIDPGAARELFYGDSDDQRATELIGQLRPMPFETMEQRSEPAWKSIPSTYVVCTHDRVFPLEAQYEMASRAAETVELDSDHSPFVTCPELLTDVLVSHLP